MEELQKLFNVLKREGYYTKSFEDFQSKYQDETYRDKVFNVVSRDGFYTKSKEEFLSKFSLGEVKKKEESEPSLEEVITESTTEQVPAENGSSASQQDERIFDPMAVEPEVAPATEQRIAEPFIPQDQVQILDEATPIGPSEFDPEEFVAPEQPLVQDAYPGLFEAESDLVDRVGDKLARKYDRLGEDVEEFMPEIYADALDEARKDKKFISSYDALPEELKATIEPGLIRENGEIVGLDQSLIPTESVKEIVRQYDKDEFEDTEGVIENLAGAIESQRKEDFFVKLKKAGQLQEDILNNKVKVDELRKQGNDSLADQLSIPLNKTIEEYNNLVKEANDDSIIINSLDIISENEDMYAIESGLRTAAGTLSAYTSSAPKKIIATLAHVANKIGYSPGLVPISSNVYENISESAMQDALKIEDLARESFGQDYRDKKANFVGETLGQIGFVVASTALGGTPAALSAGYTMSTGEMYREAINSRLSHNDAMNLSVVYGAISAPLERLPFRNAFKKVGERTVRKKIIQEIIKKGGKNFTKEFAKETVKLSLKPILKETLKEASEEGFQEGVQYLLSKGLAETYNSLKDEDKPEFLKAKLGSDEFIEEFIQTVALGSVAGSIGSVSLNLAGGNVFVGSDYKAMENMFTDPNQMAKIDQQLDSYRKTGQIKTDEELQSAKEQVGIVAQASSEVQNATKNSKISIGLKKQLFKLTSEKISLEKAIEGVKTTSLVSDKKQTIQDLDQKISDIVSGKVTEKDIIAEQETATEEAPEVKVEEEVTEEVAPEEVTLSKKVDNIFNETNPEVAETLSDNLVRNKSAEFELSSIGQSIVDQATKAAVAIQRVAPNVRVVLHDTTKEYTDFAKEGSRGSYNPATKTIHIDLSKANKKTVGHEAFHSILFNTIGTEKDIQAATDDMYKSVKRSLATSPLMKRKLRKFSEKYGENIQSEEALSELFGMLSSDYKKLSAPVKIKIKQFVNKVATKFGLGDIIKLSEQDLSDIETIDLLNTMATRVKEGEAITEEDVDILKSEPYTEGVEITVNPDAPMTPQPRQSKIIYDDIPFAQNLPVISMSDFIKRVEGKIFAITSDATKIGYDSKGDRIDGGFGYSAIKENINNKIGFASLDVKVGTTTLGKITKRYKAGDKIGVVIMVQNPSATVGNYYGGKYLGRGLLTLKNKSPEKYNEVIDGFVDLLNNNTIKKELKKEKADKAGLINLISNPDKFTESEFAAEWINDTTFEMRRKILESLLIDNDNVKVTNSTNPTKAKLKDAGFNTLDFLMEYGDVKLIGENNIKNNIGGFAVGGFEMIVPKNSKQAAVAASERGFVHPQFNGKIPSNGNNFIFDGLYPVNENFLEFATPETKIKDEYKTDADELVRKTFKDDNFYNKKFLTVNQYRKTLLKRDGSISNKNLKLLKDFENDFDKKNVVNKKDRGYRHLKSAIKIKFKESNPKLLIESDPNVVANIARGMGFAPDVKTPISEKAEFTPATREQKMDDAKTPGTRIVTTAKEILFKGMQPKTKEGKPFSVHTIKKGSFAAVDKALASDYKGDKPLKQFTIPEGTTVDVVKVGETNQGVTKVRRLEEELIDNSDAQIVKLITQDTRGYSEQYIIKDDSILESGVDVVEEITKTIKQKDERKEKIAEGNKLFNKKQLQDATKIANRISERTGIDYKDAERISKLDKERAKKISDAYEKAKSEPEKREVKEAYSALIDETILQYEEILLDGYTVEVSNDEYLNSGEMIDDLIENKNMRIFSTESGFGAEGITDAARKSNPMLKKTKFKDKNGVPLLVNDVFRFVHDFFGHAKMGNGFGPLGEENAWNVHSRMYSPLARRAMTTETRGQNSWVNFSGINENAFKVRDEARALRKKAQSSDNKKDAIALLREAERKINEVYDMMSFAEQKVALLSEEFTKTDDEISTETETTRAVREQKDDEIPEKTKNRITKLADRLKKKFNKDTDPNIILEDVLNNLQRLDKWYETANDTQRENAVRFARKYLKFKEKTIPKIVDYKGKVRKIFNLITDINKIDLKEQIDIAKSLKQRAKLTAKEKKVLDDSLNETLKELEGQGKLTTNQVKAVFRKFQNVDVFSTSQVESFVDYMTKVFADADYLAKIRDADSKLPKARNNIKKGKTGINEVGPLLSKLFRINPRLIPSQFLDKYLDIVDTLSKQKKELELDLESITKNAEEILNYMDSEFSKVNWLASGFEDYVAENKSKVKGKSFTEIVSLMKEDGVIDDSDAAIMKKYRSIISPTKKTTKTEKEIQEEKDELIGSIKENSKEKNPIFSTNEELALAKQLKELINTKGIEELSVSELRTLLQVINNINQGLVTNNAFLLREKLDSLKNSSPVKESLFNATVGAIEKRYNKVKSYLIGNKKNYIQKTLESNPLYYIDQVFGDGKTKDLFNSLIRGMAEGEQNFNYDIRKIYKKLDDASNAVRKSFKGSRNKLIESSAKQFFYMLELEYNSNKDKTKVKRASEYLEETINLAKVNERDIDMLEKIREAYVVDGIVDMDKLYSSFNIAEKKSIKVAQEINQYLAPKALYIAGVIRGQKINILNNYVHHVVVNDKFDGKVIDDSHELMKSMNESLKPSTKAKPIIERQNVVTALNFDIYNSVKRGSKSTLLDFHLTAPIKTARATLKETKKALEKDGSYKSKKDIYEGLDSLMESTISNFIYNSVASSGDIIGEKVLARIAKIGYQRVLADTGRMTRELISNMSFVLNRGREEYYEGLKYRGVSSETTAQAMRNLGSLQTGRLFSDLGIKSRFSEKLFEDKLGVIGKKNKSKIMDTLGIINYYSLNPLVKGVDTLADGIISKPDQIMSRPLWKGAFASTFKQETGESFPEDGFERIAANDQAFMSEHKNALEVATKKADDISIEAAASSGLFTGISRGKDASRKRNLGMIFANFNNYMSTFLNYEYQSFRKGLMAARGNGMITEKEGRQLMAAVVTRMFMYTFLSSVITKGVLGTLRSILGYAEGEEEEDRNLLKEGAKSIIQTFIGLFLGRNFGNLMKGIQNTIIEGVNEKHLDFLRDGEYDKYKDSLGYPLAPKKKDYEDEKIADYIYTFSGPYGKALELGDKALKVKDDILEPSKKADAKKREKQRLKRFVFFEIPAFFGYVPFAREIEKELNSFMYKDFRKGGKSKKRELSIAERNAKYRRSKK